MTIIVMLAVIIPAAGRVLPASVFDINSIKTYKDIPGVTEGEITAIEELKKQRDSLVYGASLMTETFIDVNGEIRGFTVLFCDWMTALFGIQFKTEIHDLGDVLAKLKTGEVNFGALTATEERLKTYYMTAPIIHRSVKLMRISGGPSPDEIVLSRPVRYLFMEGGTIIDSVTAAFAPGSYEAIVVRDHETVYRMLKNTDADAFIGIDIAEAAFDTYGDVFAEDFLPLVVTPVSLTAEDLGLAPIISVVTKALNNGAYRHLTELYRQGYKEYLKNKFLMQLSEEEKTYIKNTPVIPFASQYMSYPITFYNANEKRWEGVVFDVLDEMEQLTGLKFELVNGPAAELPELMNLLENGTAYCIPNLIQSDERRARFIWPKTMYLFDRFALLSKRSYPNVELNDIPFERIGFARGSAFADVFRSWFPGAMYTTEYPTTDDAFIALDRGEIDLMMSSQSRLTTLTNYYEFSDYKANYLFNAAFDASFGLNKDQTVLCSIIDKALPLIDTGRIAEQWMSRTYNIETMRLQEQRPWLFSAIGLSMCVIILIVALLVRSRNIGKHLEKIIKQRTNELAAVSEAKSQFLANMSHEIRTPMNAIIGFSELALDGGNTAKIKKYLRHIMENSKGLLQIINDILDISKIESGKMELEYIPFDLHEMFAACQVIIMPKAVEKGITLHFYAEPLIGKKLLGDPTRLRQVLLNLLTNAVKFTHTGIVKLSAAVKGQTNGSINMRFEVRDSGIGMTSEQVARIFDPFMQADETMTRKYGGTGLGLSITKNIVEMMGGTLAVESIPKVGSIFSFDVTFQTVGTHDEDARQEITFNESERPIFKGEVLLCEDNKMNQNVIREHLARVGLKTVVAENGKAGVDAVQSRVEKGEKQFDLIFMDIHMPVMDGLEASAKILELNTGIPIVAMTANVMTNDREIYKMNGIHDCVGKPFTSQELWRCLLKYLTPVSYKAVTGTETVRNGADLKLLADFVKSHRNTFNDIREALDAGDVKLAHRLAHTLRGTAGIIGRTELREIAGNMEQALANGEIGSAERYMSALERALGETLAELEPLLGGLRPLTPPDRTLDSEQARRLLEKLEPLLDAGNLECLEMISELRTIEGSGTLTEQIEDFEFKSALKTLSGLKQALEARL
jgi:signal transduction histidine kinase/CheY-like chemotaxis protein